MSVQQVFHHFQSQLSGVYDAGEALEISLQVMEETLGLDRHIVRNSTRSITEAEQARLEVVLSRLQTGEPLQYVLGHAWFLGERYLVNPSTLIPRPETEELVHWILEDHPSIPPLRVLDLGTGSGCIAIALMRARPEYLITAVDISETAIETAKQNARDILSNTEGIRFQVQDLLDESWWERLEPFDLIISNPPYIAGSEKAGMHPNVLAHEPDTALFVPDEDPLYYYRHIAAAARNKLTGSGRLYVEINERFGKETIELMESTGFQATLKKDLHGKDRMIRAILQ